MISNQTFKPLNHNGWRRGGGRKRRGGGKRSKGGGREDLEEEEEQKTALKLDMKMNCYSIIGITRC